jgi:hypothetical protein
MWFQGELKIFSVTFLPEDFSSLQPEVRSPGVVSAAIQFKVFFSIGIGSTQFNWGLAREEKPIARQRETPFSEMHLP